MNPGTIENLSIREATRSDLDLLVDFNTAMALETENRHLDRERLWAGTKSVLESNSQGVYLVGEVYRGAQSSQVVGQLLITYEWSDWRNANFWWIQSAYVHPDWRSQGVFRSLYQYVVQQARSRSDVCGLRLYVEQGNTTAQAVYDKLGLECTPYRILEVDFVLAGHEKVKFTSLPTDSKG